jgi:filamentous hemagglutinin family protein
MTAAATIGVGALSPVIAGPTGGVVVEGQGSISSPNSGATVINQASQNLQLNWNSFNVGANESVQFNQPSSKATAFNRILDQNPSQIFGRIDANGQVVLVNPNGLLIGRTAQLNVNSLVVSSLDAIDFDAASGRYRFSTARSETGAVVNDGTITAGPGGSVTLLGGRVSNTGSIVADYGTVNLAAGRAATIDLAGDGLLRLEVGSDLISNSSGAANAVENSGAIQANGGQVLLTSSAMDSVFTNLINNTGVVRANRIDNSGGTIRLIGPEGMVLSSGTLDASAGDDVSTGGSVAVLGDRVGMLGNAVVDVSGATGGGTALIGGDFQGSNPEVLNATRTYVSSGATLNADAGTQGDGGRIIVWANGSTRYDGSLSARGGSLWGNGGFAEVSGKGNLSFNGRAFLSAAHGSWGSLLLDPTDITIDNSSATTTDLDASGGNYLVTDDPGIPVTIGNATIEQLLHDAGFVTLRASNSITQNADATIDVRADAGAANKALTLTTDAGGTGIDLNGKIFTNNGAISLNAGGGTVTMGTGSVLNAGSAAVTVTSDGDITVTDIISTGGTVTLNAGGSILNDGDFNTRITAPFLNLTANGAIGVNTATGAVDTSVNNLTALAGTGSLFVRETDNITLNDLRAQAGGARISVISVTGDITTRTLFGTGGVSLTAGQGSIVDDGFGTGISAIAGTVSLSAGHSIGTISNFALRQGQPIRIVSASKIAATSVDGNARFNLLIPTSVTVDNGAIRLSNGDGQTGQILIQSSGALNTSQFAPGAIFLGPNNTASVKLSAGVSSGADNLLTLNSAGSITSSPAGTLVLHGSDIRDNDGTPDQIALSAKALTIEASSPGANKTLVTDIDELNVSFGTSRNLTVNEAGTLTLGDIDVINGDVSITANSGAILDDHDNTTVVTGHTVALSAQQVGQSGDEIDTEAVNLNLTATGGSAYAREANDVVLTAAAPGAVDVKTLDGAMTVTSASGSNVTLETAGTAPRDLTLNGAVSSPFGNVTLKAGGTGFGGHIISNTLQAVSANNLSLTGRSIGVIGSRLQTNASSIASTSTGGSTFITEADDLTSLTADANGGYVDVLANGSLHVNSINTTNGVILVTAGPPGGSDLFTGLINGGNGGIQLTANGADADIHVNGNVITTDNVTLTAGTVGNRGDIVTDINGQVNGINVTATGATIGVSAADRLKTNATFLNATATNGGIYVQEASSVILTASATGDVDVASALQMTASSVSGRDVTLKAGDNVTQTNRDLTVSGPITAQTGRTVTLTASGVIAGSGQVSGGTLKATGRSIGSSTTRFSTAVDSLDTTSTTGDTYITEANGVTLKAGAAGAVDVRATGALAVTSVAGGTGVTLTTWGNGNDITLNGAVNGGAGPVLVDATGDGSGIALNSTITTSGDVTLRAGSMFPAGALSLGASSSITADDLTIDAVSIGSNTTRLQTNVATLTATSTNGDIYVQEANGLGLTATANNGTVNVATTNGALSVSGASGNGVTLEAGGANALTLNGAVDGGAGGTVSLSAGGAIVAGGGNSVVADTLNASGTSIGNTGARLATTVATLNTHSTAGGTFITEADGVSLAATAVGGGIDVETTNGALSAGAISSTGTGSGVRLVANGAGNALSLSGSVDGGSGAIVLNAAGDGSAVNLGGAVTTTAGSVSIVAGSNANRGALVLGAGASVSGIDVNVRAASIGTPGGALVTNATSLDAQTTSGGIYVQEANDLNLTAIAGGGDVDVATTSGSLTVATATGTGVALSAGATGGITLNGAVDAGPAGTVVLTAGGAIVEGASGSVTANSLTASGSAIGSSAARLITDVASLNTTSTNGGTFITEANDVSLNASVTNGALDVDVTAGVLNAGTVARSGTGGGVRLVANGDFNALTVGTAVDGGNADVVLEATGAVANVNLNGAITTTGDVTIAAGSTLNRGDLVLAAGSTVAGDAVTVVARTIGANGGPLVTAANSLDATSAGDGIFVREADGLTLTANANGGVVNVETLNGALSVGAVTGDSVSLTSGGDGNGIALNGAITTPGDIQLAAGSVANRGAITAGGGNLLSGAALTAVASSIGASGARLNTNVTTLTSMSTNGGTYVSEADALSLNATATGGALDVRTTDGTLAVNTAVGNGITLAAGGVAQSLTLFSPVDGGAGDVSLSATGDAGGINLFAPVTTTGNATIAAGSATHRGLITVAPSALVSANALTITGASIGVANGGLATAVTSLNATATDGGLYVTETDGLTLTGSATGGALEVQTLGGAMNVASAIGDGVTLMTSGDGNSLSINGSVDGRASDVTLMTLGAGSDIRLGGVVTTTGNVTLSAGSPAGYGAIVADAGNGVNANSLFAIGSSIGGTAFALNTDVTSLIAQAMNGSLRVAEVDDLNLSATALGGSIDVATTNGALTVVAGAAAQNSVTLASGGNNDLVVDGAVFGGSDVSLTSGGGITLNGAVSSSAALSVSSHNALLLGAGNQVVADALTISASEIGTSSSRLNTSAGSLTARATNGGIYVSETDALTLDAIASGGAVDVRATDGALEVNAAIGDSVTLVASGLGGAIRTLANGGIVASSVDLTAGSIGTETARVNTATASVNATSSDGDIYLANLGALDLSAQATSGAIDVIAGGTITVANATGSGVQLAAKAAGADIVLNGAVGGSSGDVVLAAGTSAARGAIVSNAGSEIRGDSLTATGSSIGSVALRLNTRVTRATTTSTNGGTYLTDADNLALIANATGGPIDVRTGDDLTLNGAVNAGTGNVTLAAQGSIFANAGSRVTAGALDISGSSIGSNTAALNTAVTTLTARSTGGIYVNELNGLSLANVQAGGNLNVTSASGDVTVARVRADGDASLTASSGAIVDDGDDTTRLKGNDVTLRAVSVGAPSTMTGTTLDSKLRLDTDATSLDVVTTGGGIFIDELNGLASVSLNANAGTAGDIELLTAAGDLNLLSVNASDTLLLAAGHNIYGLPSLGTITARSAELRAGGADSSAGHIGTLSDPLKLQLSAGNSLHIFVPQTVSANDPNRAPATLPSAGVLTTLSLFNSPSTSSTQAGFGQFLGISDSQFTSPAEALVRAIQNQTSAVQTVVGLDWASFDPNVSLFGTLDPAVCLPGDQRDEEKGEAGC